MPTLDHPILKIVKERFAGRKLRATEYRGQTTLILEPSDLHEVMLFLRHDPRCLFDFLSDVAGIDYLNYPGQTLGRFAVLYNLCSYSRNDRIFVKTFLNPSIPTDGIVEDPALYLDSVTDIWPGAEWNEREVFDMFGIRFRNHPDLRRILTWESFPAHPLRKDYPLRGRGERENFRVVSRTDA
ncbi:MAG: NADH-quinone oxidoreductase subunit C [Planctomycetota bacterium]|nr:NADH-quinone oxidoreductase subunit C [Planctomycetota bacterium]